MGLRDRYAWLVVLVILNAVSFVVDGVNQIDQSGARWQRQPRYYKTTRVKLDLKYERPSISDIVEAQNNDLPKLWDPLLDMALIG